MGRTYDPLKKPLTTTQIAGWVLYTLIVLVSVWATGESLARSFKIPIYVAYLMGFIVSAACAAFLTVIKQGFKDRIVLSIVLATFAFLFVWSISLLTNTHQFYLVGTLDKIRKEELANAKNQIENLRNNGLPLFNQAVAEFERKANGLNTSLQKEILDEGKPGLGKLAEKLLLDIEKLLNVTITRQKATGSNQGAIKDLSRRQGSIVKELINQKVATFNQPRSEIEKYFAGTEDDEILTRIEHALNNYEHTSEEDLTKLISEAFNYYSRTFDFISERIKLIPENKIDIESYRNKLPKNSESIELEHIANSYSYVRRNQEFNQPKFLLAFAIAFAVDIAAFIIFYFMALPPSSNREWN